MSSILPYLTTALYPCSSFLLGGIQSDLFVDLGALYAETDSDLASAVHTSARHYRRNYAVEPRVYFQNVLAFVIFGGVFGGGVVARGLDLWKRAVPNEKGVPGKLKAIRSVGTITDYLVIGSSFLTFGLYVTDILPSFLKIVDNPDLAYEELENNVLTLSKGHLWAYLSLLVGVGALSYEAFVGRK